jgi:hypothetical protein
MLRAVLMQALILFHYIKVADDIDTSTNVEMVEFAYLMRERITVTCISHMGKRSVFLGAALTPRYYMANSLLVNYTPSRPWTGNRVDYSRRLDRTPDPGLIGRWRTWWRKSRRPKAGSRKEKEKEKEGEKERKKER